MITRCLRVLWTVFFLALTLAPAGCNRPQVLGVTPNVMLGERGRAVYAQTPEAWRTCDIPLLYVTDRASSTDDSGRVTYGSKRSKYLTFGTATVTLRPEVSWEKLVEDSTQQARKQGYAMGVTDVRQSIAVDDIPAFAVQDGHLVSSEQLQERRQQAVQTFYQLLRERLALTPVKDVYVFVHGFANSFDDSALRAAQVWHFLGRQGVPVVYSWPAGYGGLFGYAYDRESSEFTVFHLKQFLAGLAASPDVERIHIISHSRGTDVASAAVRELHMENTARPENARHSLKIATLVLAAPDIDVDIFVQRFLSQGATSAVDRLVVYFTPNDDALSFAVFLFRDNHRLGSLSLDQFPPAARQLLTQLPSVEFIDCNVSGFSTSHSFVFSHPAVLSDLIQVLRQRCPAGSPTDRPLACPGEGLWSVNNEYLLPRTPVQAPSSPSP